MKAVLDYKKPRSHKSSSSPRDIQKRQDTVHVAAPSDSDVLEFKKQLLELKEELFNVKSTSVKPVDGKLYTEEEFNVELIKALEKELKVGAVGQDSVEVKKLESELEEKIQTVHDLERVLEVRLNELTEIKSKVSTLEALIGAKDQTIEALQSQPINVKVSGVVGTTVEEHYDVPDMEVDVIDPTDTDVKLESFISIDEEKDTSDSNMTSDMNKLKDILGGGL